MVSEAFFPALAIHRVHLPHRVQHTVGATVRTKVPTVVLAKRSPQPSRSPIVTSHDTICSHIMRAKSGKVIATRDLADTVVTREWQTMDTLNSV